jgi:hypothetical protein
LEEAIHDLAQVDDADDPAALALACDEADGPVAIAAREITLEARDITAGRNPWFVQRDAREIGGNQFNAILGLSSIDDDTLKHVFILISGTRD